jgi:hypothetical protein
MNASEEAAASAAGHKVLTTLFPTQASTLDQLHEAILAPIRDNARKRRGLEWGESVADQILLWRSKDRSNKMVTPPGGSGPGVWQPNPAWLLALFVAPMGVRNTVRDSDEQLLSAKWSSCPK